MVAPVVVLGLVLVIAVECVIFWIDQLHRVRAEAAYWHARDTRPPLYDWARDFDPADCHELGCHDEDPS